MWIFMLMLACSDYAVNSVDKGDGVSSALIADPTALDFGDLPLSQTSTEQFTLTNPGNAAVDLDPLTIQGSTTFTVLSAPTRLEAGESLPVEISYSPSGDADQGTAVATPSDPSVGPAAVELYGGAVYPALTIDPAILDFGYTDPFVPVEDGFRLINTGGADLEIQSATAIGESFSAEAAELLPLTLAPGEETWVDATFLPEDNGMFSGELWVTTNAPASPSVAQMEGVSGDVPVAVCAVDATPAYAIYDDVTWVGRDSYDPSGLEIRHWDWTFLSVPAGSSASMPSGDADRSGFVADMAGTYTAQLVVTNELGIESEPCITALEAVPAQNLWIEMFWTHSGDDMDLHLIAPGGTTWSNTDCHWQNCVGRGLDWGVSGDTEDDPSLDIDDIPGTGPENINILAPASGIYTVAVHDYPGSVYNGENDVTVNIYISGVLAWSDTRDVDQEDLMEPFAEIDWDARTVTGL